ncbi:MAG: hypothetical protein GY778_24885, partial [bacterium]|nr:hypothetical protein [bacterium]
MLPILLSTWLALSPGGDRLTVVFERPGEVYQFDTATRTVVGTEVDRRPAEWKPFV